MTDLFGVDNKDNIALRRVHIGIFEQKHSVYTVLLEHRELDKQPDWTSQILTYHKILLTADLVVFQLESTSVRD